MKKILSLLTACLLFTLSGYSFTQIVTVQNHVFTPANFTINLGDTIKYTWLNGSHTTTSLTIPAGAASWDRPINSSSATFTYVPSKTGVYNFKCTPHFAMGMKGSFTVTACTQPTVEISADGAIVFCKGESVLLNSNVSGSVTSYQWKKDGTNITNATHATYTATGNGSFTLKVNNNCGSTATSNAINITVNQLPGASITPSDTATICSGDSVKLKANIGTALTYIWKRNGTIIPNATKNFYYAKTAGNYKVIVTKTTTGCSKTSAVTTIIITCSNAIAAKLPDNKIQVFPNPSSNNFHIVIPSTYNNQYTISIFNVDGTLIESKKIISGDFSFGSEFKPGIYFIEIGRDNVIIVKEKVIKN